MKYNETLVLSKAKKFNRYILDRQTNFDKSKYFILIILCVILLSERYE